MESDFDKQPPYSAAAKSHPPPNASVHESIEAVVHVTGLDSPSKEQAIYLALGELAGVEEVRIEGGRIFVRYEPTLGSEAKIRQALANAGFETKTDEIVPASALVDALKTTALAPDDTPPTSEENS